MAATEEGSDNGVGATKADPTGKLLQQAWDGTGRAWRWRFESYCRAIGWKEQFPHCLQSHLPIGYKCAPRKKRERRKHRNCIYHILSLHLMTKFLCLPHSSICTKKSSCIFRSYNIIKACVLFILKILHSTVRVCMCFTFQFPNALLRHCLCFLELRII